MAPEEIVPALKSAQNPDGGWSYQRGSTSWTEPTCLALLALNGIPGASPSVARGLAWLRHTQRADGGWAPQPAVDQSTWVTSLCVLVFSDVEKSEAQKNAAEWLLAQAGKTATTTGRLPAWLFGQKQDDVQPGWSWYPGTASWVIPTSMSILALKKVACNLPDSRFDKRIAQGREFLFARQCAGGGWNHGGTSIRSEDAHAYPEATGIALLAMNSHSGERLRPALQCGMRLLNAAESREGENWLRLGLTAHGYKIEPRSQTAVNLRTSVACALEVITAKPHNPFLASATV